MKSQLRGWREAISPAELGWEKKTKNKRKTRKKTSSSVCSSGAGRWNRFLRRGVFHVCHPPSSWDSGEALCPQEAPQAETSAPLLSLEPPVPAARSLCPQQCPARPAAARRQPGAGGQGARRGSTGGLRAGPRRGRRGLRPRTGPARRLPEPPLSCRGRERREGGGDGAGAWRVTGPVPPPGPGFLYK